MSFLIYKYSIFHLFIKVLKCFFVRIALSLSMWKSCISFLSVLPRCLNLLSFLVFLDQQELPNDIDLNNYRRNLCPLFLNLFNIISSRWFLKTLNATDMLISVYNIMIQYLNILGNDNHSKSNYFCWRCSVDMFYHLFKITTYGLIKVFNMNKE